MGTTDDGVKKPTVASGWNRRTTKRKKGEEIVLGDGVNVPPSHQQHIARVWFLAALMATAPHVHEELLNVENLRLAVDACRAPAGSSGSGHPLAADQLAAVVREWQVRHHLEDAWILDAAISTLYRAVRPIITGHDESFTVEKIVPARVWLYPATSEDTGPWTDKLAQTGTAASGPLDFGPIPLWTELPVFLDDLYLRAEHNADAEGDGLLGTFDPRTETVDAVTKKLLGELETRVRRVLTAIVAEDREKNGARKPESFRSHTPFVWLVRVQVLQEAYEQIAYDANKKQSAVEKAVRKTRKQVGLSKSPARGPKKRK